MLLTLFHRSRKESEDLASLNQPYSTVGIPSRQDSVADNPIYGTPQVSPQQSMDTKEPFYESVNDIAQKKACTQAKQPSPYEREYSTISDNTSAPVKNPVYGGPVRYSQIQFGKFN